MNAYPIHSSFDANPRAVGARPQFRSRGLITAACQPVALEDFGPKLQKRGLHGTQHTGSTRRDNFGLWRPSVGAWRVLLAVAGKEQTA